jgi:hypothetical protein
MALNQASFFLFPPRYGPEVEFDHTAKTPSGESLAIISTTIIDPDAPKVLAHHVREWFVSRGFCEKERYGELCVLFRGRQTTPFGTQEEIELELPLDEEEVQKIYLRFLLTENTPKAISTWRDLVSDLGRDFGFRLMDAGHRLLPCTDFLTVAAENWNFATFQKES